MKRVVFTIVALLATLLPVLPARAESKIEFVNPSGYMTPAVVISDKADQDNVVHLVAWVREVPANPLVEFEFTSATGIPNLTIDAFREGNDTWEGTLNLGGINDGTYILRARLYANFTGPGTGAEVAATEQNVAVNSSDIPPPQEANTVEMTYPSNSGPLGFFKPTGKNVNFLVDGIASLGTFQARALYSTTAPGNAPQWNACGGGRVGSDQLVRVRCTLADNVSGSAVTAVALVANDTPPPADPATAADASGDAHRVIPYAQVPQRVVITPATVTSDVSSCPIFSAETFDQSGRAIAAANMDVHVLGPDDQIQFGVIERTTSPQAAVLTNAFQAPDKAHPSSRAAWNCGSNEGDDDRRQGDHNIPGANDPQHIESTDGTNNQGTFVFALRSASMGGSQVEAWIDTNDDDVVQASEGSGGARIGWGQPPPEATQSVLLEPSSSSATTGSCQRIVLAARESGNPLVGRNVDVHVSGPNETVAFCSPGSDASTGRQPDQGHIGGADDAQTRHLEGETDTSGRFIFGVTAAAEGSTTVTGWLDSPDDDVLSGEPSRSGSIDWAISGNRSISIDSDKNRVRRGRRVAIFGEIDGATACSASQVVRIKAKRVSGGRFRTIKSTTTDANGDYRVRIRVRKSKRYFAQVPRDGACERAKSRRITVRARS